jgi:long-chain acyl-CoA synthetase
VKIEPDPDRPGDEGEILVRGPNIMQGYYNLPEKTAEVLSPDGWFRTGDIGLIDDDGFIVITDRKKDLIKTSGGKFVAPQPLENELKTSRYVSQAVVVGNRRKYASVLIVPNMDTVLRYAREHNIATDDPRVVLESGEVQTLFEELLEKINHDKASYETLKKFCLVVEDFTIEAGELTPTLKVKRRVIEEKYDHLIDTMYDPEVVLTE